MTHSVHDIGCRPAKFRVGFLGVAMTLALVCAAVSPQTAFAAEKEQQNSRGIAKEMTAAQKALQANQWQEALKNLDAAEAKANEKPPLTPFDMKTIHYFKAFANIKLNNLKVAQGEFEKALATGAATAGEKGQNTKTLFGIAASTQQFQKAIDYGKEMADAGTASPNDIAIIAQSYFQLKDCKNSGIWVDKAVAAGRKAGELPKEHLLLFKFRFPWEGGDTP